MRGVIGTKEVVTNFGVIWREFGPRCALRCAAAVLCRRPTTFLEIAFARRGCKRGLR